MIEVVFALNNITKERKQLNENLAKLIEIKSGETSNK